jgi:hypothetical protein
MAVAQTFPDLAQHDPWGTGVTNESALGSHRRHSHFWHPADLRGLYLTHFAYTTQMDAGKTGAIRTASRIRRGTLSGNQPSVNVRSLDILRVGYAASALAGPQVALRSSLANAQIRPSGFCTVSPNDEPAALASVDSWITLAPLSAINACRAASPEDDGASIAPIRSGIMRSVPQRQLTPRVA